MDKASRKEKYGKAFVHIRKLKDVVELKFQKHNNFNHNNSDKSQQKDINTIKDKFTTAPAVFYYSINTIIEYS